MRRDVFQAIADPTRREILDILSTQELNLNAVAGHFEVSRPAISRHVKILSECGLIEITRSGRQRYCKARPGKLHEVADWVDKYKKFWSAKLDALDTYLNSQQNDSSENKTKRPV